MRFDSDSRKKVLAMTMATALLFWFPFPCRANGDMQCGNTWLEYEPTLVQLRGMLSAEQVYGPPGFGENPLADKKQTIYVLTLTSGINVHGRADDALNASSFRCVTKLQIVFPNDPVLL